MSLHKSFKLAPRRVFLLARLRERIEEREACMATVMMEIKNARLAR